MDSPSLDPPPAPGPTARDLSDRLLAGSYYRATALPRVPAPALAGAHRADLVVVGGGTTGLSAALHAAEAGRSVILLEAATIGVGASGRNGGQVIPGLRKGLAELERDYGRERAAALFGEAVRARDLLVDLAGRLDIACDLKTTGYLTVAHKPQHEAWLEEEAGALQRFGYGEARLLSSVEVAGELTGRRYHGGLLDLKGGHIHPLNYALGLAAAAERAGVRIFETAPVTALHPDAGGMRVETATGTVKADACVLAADALLGRLEPRLAIRFMPITSYMVATAPLPDPQALIPHDRAISDSKFVVAYFRMSADGRLLFGGGETYSQHPPRDIAHFVRHYLGRVFPQLRACRIDHAWGGLVSVTRTRLPHIGRFGPLFFAHGYSGQGVAMSLGAGQMMAEAFLGRPERLDLFAAIAPPAFPGGTLLRGPMHTAGMLWYALRDRL